LYEGWLRETDHWIAVGVTSNTTLAQRRAGKGELVDCKMRFEMCMRI